MNGRAAPVRTCVGCRERAYRSDLLRVVMVGDRLVPDPRGRAPGRGAHLHPSIECLDLAERRKAFGRALRLAASPDTAEVRAHVAQIDDRPAGRSDEPGTDRRVMSAR